MYGVLSAAGALGSSFCGSSSVVGRSPGQPLEGAAAGSHPQMLAVPREGERVVLAAGAELNGCVPSTSAEKKECGASGSGVTRAPHTDVGAERDFRPAADSWRGSAITASPSRRRQPKCPAAAGAPKSDSGGAAAEAAAETSADSARVSAGPGRTAAAAEEEMAAAAAAAAAAAGEPGGGIGPGGTAPGPCWGANIQGGAWPL
mmetsp:Transcript_10542/g.43016  ORF Transcript_10542/g.43016 Transcript_10542/m.43016 type:complete len:203 (-) Transcript_10542:1561-2169(-)